MSQSKQEIQAKRRKSQGMMPKIASAQKTMKNQFMKNFTSRVYKNNEQESSSPRRKTVSDNVLPIEDPNKQTLSSSMLTQLRPQTSSNVNQIITEKELIQEAREKKKKIIELISLDFEDIRISNEAFIKLKLAEYAVTFVAAIQIGASVVYNELQQFEKKMYEFEYLLLLRLNYITTAINLLLIIFRFQMHLKWSISKGYYTRIDTLATTEQIKFVIIEMIIVALNPYEFLQEFQFLEYSSMTHSGVVNSTNEIMTVLSMLKSYFFLRTFMYFSRFNDPRAQRVCQMNGCKATSLFAIKSIIQESPYKLTSVIFISSAVVSAYAMQVFERHYSSVSGQDFDSFWNSLWLIIVTMTTVGYGDLYPKSYGGRVVGIITCIWGIFLASFFTVTLTNFLSFTPSQNKAYLLLQRLYWKEMIQRESVKAVATLYKHKLLARKQDIFDLNTKIDPKLLSSARKFRKHMVKFKETTRKMFNYNEGNTETQYLTKEVERLSCRVDEMADDMEKQRKDQSIMNNKLDLILKALNQPIPSTNAPNSNNLLTPKQDAKSARL